MKVPDRLIQLMGTIALLWYYFCLIKLGANPIKTGADPDSFYQFMSISITTLGGTLATFVGMILGIQTVEGDTASPPGSAFLNLATTSLQWWAAGLYLLSLLIALAFWATNPSGADPAVVNLGKSLLGLFGGALSINLNMKNQLI